MQIAHSDPTLTLVTAPAADALRTLSDGCVDLTVTSPPYDTLRTYTGEAPWDWDAFEAVAAELFRVTSDGGVVVWNVSDQTSGGSESGTSMRQALHFMSLGFKLADTMIYKKANPGGARGWNSTYIQCWEYMFVLSKGTLRTHNLICDRPNKEVGQRNGGGGRREHGGSRTTKSYVSQPFGRRFNVWEYATQNDDFAKRHPAPFPLKLAEDHIKSWSNPGDLVLDPFSGSGTTCLAAINLGRRAFGIDVSAEYTEIAIERLTGGSEAKAA